jgi:hypothetical protein
MAHEKRLLIDVFQAYFYRKNPTTKNRELVFMSENLTSGSISTTQENTDVRNGQGNTLFAVLPGSKDVTVSLTENVFSFEALKLNTGVETEETIAIGDATGNSGMIIRKSGKYKSEDVIFDADASALQSIDGGDLADRANLALIKMCNKVPQKVEELKVSIGTQEFAYVDNAAGVGGVGADQYKYTLMIEQTDDAGAGRKEKKYKVWTKDTMLAKNQVLFVAVHKTNAEPLKTNGDFKVLPYIYITNGAGVKTLTVSAKEFSEGGELWLQTLEKDEKQRPTAYVYFVFENAMPEGSFEISTVSEVQPNDMVVNMRILADENGDLYRIVREEITE